MTDSFLSAPSFDFALMNCNNELKWFIFYQQAQLIF